MSQGKRIYNQDHKCHAWERESFIQPRKSEGTFPFENLPVDIPPLKSLPYGEKLHFTTDLRSLLFPVSTMESPNMMNAGIVSFLGSWMADSEVHKTAKTKERNNNVVDKEKCFILIKWSIAIDFSFWDSYKLEFKWKNWREWWIVLVFNVSFFHFIVHNHKVGCSCYLLHIANCKPFI